MNTNTSKIHNIHIRINIFNDSTNGSENEEQHLLLKQRQNKECQLKNNVYWNAAKKNCKMSHDK